MTKHKKRTLGNGIHIAYEVARYHRGTNYSNRTDVKWFWDKAKAESYCAESIGLKVSEIQVAKINGVWRRLFVKTSPFVDEKVCADSVPADHVVHLYYFSEDIKFRLLIPKGRLKMRVTLLMMEQASFVYNPITGTVLKSRFSPEQEAELLKNIDSFVEACPMKTLKQLEDEGYLHVWTPDPSIQVLDGEDALPHYRMTAKLRYTRTNDSEPIKDPHGETDKSN